MIRRIAFAALLTATLAAPGSAQDASVAGRPALTTKSTQDLIKQRETWGKAPAKSSAAAPAAGKAAAAAAAVAAPAAAAAASTGPAVGGRPALPTTSTADLIKERETWGKAPAGKAATITERAKAAGRKVKEKATKAYRATKKAVKKAVNKVRGKQG